LVVVLGRTGEAIRVRSMSLHTRQAVCALEDVAELAAFRFVITRRNHRDEVRCEYVSQTGEDLSEMLHDRIRDALRFNAEVQQVQELPAESSLLVDQRFWDI